jgi:chromosome segregation ATPase
MDEALKEIDRQISEKEVQRLEMEASMSRLTEASETLEQTISKASEVQTAAQKKLTQLAEMLNLHQSEDQTAAWKIKSEIDTLRSASERSLATILKRREENQMVFVKMEDLREEIEGVEKEIARLEAIIKERDEFSRIKEGIFERNPIVETLGTIHAGTTIRGPHASVVIGENHRRVRIVEQKLEKKNVAKPWRMVVKRR